MARKCTVTQLWRQYERKRCVENRNALVEHYLPLVDRIFRSVTRGASRYMDTEAIQAAGVLGLIQSVERFDRARGFTFSSFAWRRIAGAMRDEMRRMDHLTRSDRRATKSEDLEPIHVVAVADIMCSDIREAVHDADESADELLFPLPVREATVVYLKMWKGLSMAEIADALRMSQSGVSRVYRMAIEALRREYQDDSDTLLA